MLNSIKLITDHSTATAAVMAMANAALLADAASAGMGDSPASAAYKAALDAVSAARDGSPLDAAVASVDAADAIYGEHTYRFEARWRRLDQYVIETLGAVLDEC